MDADIHRLYDSDYYRIVDFKCRCKDCVTSKPEYSDNFSISFVRKGNFLFNVFRNSLDSFNGCVLITKPGAERTVTHIHPVPDECTIFDFKTNFYAELLEQFRNSRFFRNDDLHTSLIKTDPELEFLHYYILRGAIEKSLGKLEMDSLVMDVVERVLSSVTDYMPDSKINDKLKKNHLATIERAKDYMNGHFSNDISLLEIAQYSFVSPFHFSRIFKTFTSYSPHRFLLLIRLQHAAMLIRNTSLPVADIAFSSGFNSIEYFSAAFRQQFNCPPLRFRNGSGVTA